MNYIPNQLWDLKSIEGIEAPSSLRLRLGSIEENLQKEIDFSIVFKRRSSYYIINNIFPSLILNAVTLLLFSLPFNLQATLSNYHYTKI